MNKAPTMCRALFCPICIEYIGSFEPYSDLMSYIILLHYCMENELKQRKADLTKVTQLGSSEANVRPKGSGSSVPA